MHKISERDWKVFRSLHEVALTRFCDRVLAEVQAIASSGAQSRQRYYDIYDLIKTRDKEMAILFDGLGRSAAFDQLVRFRHDRLITGDEFAAFSPEMRDAVETYLKIMTR
jgi:hypothetical protein